MSRNIKVEKSECCDHPVVCSRCGELCETKSPAPSPAAPGAVERESVKIKRALFYAKMLAREKGPNPPEEIETIIRALISAAPSAGLMAAYRRLKDVAGKTILDVQHIDVQGWGFVNYDELISALAAVESAEEVT